MPSRPRPSPSTARQAVATAVMLALSACATDEIKRAPARPDEPWTVPQDSDYVTALRQASRQGAARGTQPNLALAPGAYGGASGSTEGKSGDLAPQNRLQVEPDHRYTLPELIDIAMRYHPQTQEAWEAARKAGLAVGLAEHVYLPELVATVIGGYQRTPFPAPQSVIPAGFFTFTTAEVVPMLALKWLLFDFGQTAAKVHEAEAKSFIANAAFTEAHEQIVFTVNRDYLALGSARARVQVAKFAAKNARSLLDISEAKRAQGLATVVDVAQAQRQTAQGRFGLVRAQGDERNAYRTLVASMGVDPNGIIEVADNSEQPLPTAPPEDLRALIEKALVNQPDVVAALGNVRVAEATLQGAKAAYRPTLKLSAQAYEMIGFWSLGGPFFGLTEPGLNAMASIELPLFEGGKLQAEVASARSGVASARAALDGARDKAVQAVTTAYDQLQTSLAAYQAAVEVVESAATALEAAVAAYRQGVGPLSEAITAANAASESQMQKETARASVFTSTAELAFAVGSAARK